MDSIEKNNCENFVTDETNFLNSIFKKSKKKKNEFTQSLLTKTTNIFDSVNSKTSNFIDDTHDKFIISKAKTSYSTQEKYLSFTNKITDITEDLTFKNLFYNSLDLFPIVELAQYFGKDFKTKTFKERIILELILYALNIFEKHKNAVLKEIENEKEAKRLNKKYNKEEKIRAIIAETKKDLEKLRSNKYYDQIPEFLRDHKEEIPNNKIISILTRFFKL